MDMFGDETEFTDVDVFQSVVNMFERRRNIQRILKHSLGLEYDYELGFPGEDDYGNWARHHDSFQASPRLSDRSSDRRLSGNHTRSSSSVYQPSHQYYASPHDASSPSSLKGQSKENDTERKTKLLQESKKSKGKADKKKKKKKQKQKERKRREKAEKEKQNVRNEEGKDDAEQSEAEESKPVNDEDKDDTNSSVKPLAAAKDTDSSDSSEHESSDEDGDPKDDSDDSEELDMTSTFVSKAALIAKRKLEQKPNPGRTEKKKIPDKEERKTVPDKPNQGQMVEKKDSAASTSPTFEDNVKISTDLAVIGNRFASAGDFNMAVKYFTDAIKYNPTEFKLFGNRSFCFEKLQEYDKALTDAELSLGICPGWVKGLFRKGRALAGLKRFEEAARAFRDVLKLDSSCAEAAQELMRVQITQLMECGFTREQSSNALIIHGTVKKALEVLSRLNCGAGAVQSSTLTSVQVANVSGVSPGLSANTNPAAAAAAGPPAQSLDAPKKALIMSQPLGLVQNMSNVQSQSKPFHTQSMKTNNDYNRPHELFPVWVGNLDYTITEAMITDLFNKVGVVYSVKVLISKRCAFVNFTKQECCDEAIRRFHGYELNGLNIAVRYPDRIPPGMGISRSALRADHLQDENMRQNEYADGRNAVGMRRPVRPYAYAPNHRGNY